MNQISTVVQLNAQIYSTYILAVICAGACILLSFGIANLISYKGGEEDKSYVKRRVWFLLLGFIAVAAFFLSNYFIVVDSIKGPALQAKYVTSLSISAGGLTASYILGGLLLMLIFKKSKYGSILNRKNIN